MNIELLPCPFCGEKPVVDKNMAATSILIGCLGAKCHVKPFVYESVNCKPDFPEAKTFRPMFEDHEASVAEKWNRRIKND